MKTALTKLENELLRCWSIERTFCAETNSWQEAVWAFCVADQWKAEGNDPKSLGGVIASLVKKGILGYQDRDADTHAMVWFTDEGAVIMEDRYPRFTKKEEYFVTVREIVEKLAKCDWNAKLRIKSGHELLNIKSVSESTVTGVTLDIEE